MASFRDMQFVRTVILGNEVTRFIIFTADRTRKESEHAAESPAACATTLESQLKLIHGVVRVEAYRRSDVAESGGSPSDKRRNFVWDMLGTAEVSRDERPIVHHHAPPAADASPAMLALHLRLQEMELKVKHDGELRVIEQRIEEIRREREQEEEEEEEEEEDDEPESKGMDPKDIKEIAATVRDILREFRTPPISGPVAAGAPITGAPGTVSGDKEALGWLDDWAANNPAEFKLMREKFAEQYGKPKE